MSEHGVSRWLNRIDPKETISSLILAFQGHRIAKQLRVPGSSIKLDRDLASLYSRLGNEDINTECFMPLIEAIVAQVTDVEIWKLVLQLIDLTKPINPINPKDPTTPPTSQPSFCGTPRMSNSGSHEGFEETADSGRWAKRRVQELFIYSCGRIFRKAFRRKELVITMEESLRSDKA